LLDPLAPEVGAGISEALAQKDAASLRAIGKRQGFSRALATQLTALLEHYGDSHVLDSAARCFRSRSAQAALRNLRAITRRFQELGLAHRICFDLSETRGLSYYTGMHFSILAHGPGEVLGGGGRYDRLLERFGFDAPATGFALDLGHLQSTLPASGRAIMVKSDVRVAIGGSDRRRVQQLAEQLRAADLVAATLPDVDDAARGLAFARTWGYDAVLTVARAAIVLVRVADGSKHTLRHVDPDLVRRFAASPNGE
jgi:ATP phosphoribosyltransferase regulatory subunit